LPRSLPPIWLARPSRYAGLPRSTARWLIAALALLLLASLGALRVESLSKAQDQFSTLSIYENAIEGVRAGNDYYAVTSSAMRAAGEPVRPFFAIRLPTHALVQSLMPRWLAVVVLEVLMLGVAVAWWQQLASALPRFPAHLSAVVLLAGGLIVFVQGDLVALHAVWTAPLIALSLAIRRPKRWHAAVSLGLIATLVHEAAALYVIVMALAALVEGERQEALAWAGALALLTVTIAAHAYGVARVTTPMDLASGGWTGPSGVGLFTSATAGATALQALPLAIAAPMITLALFGWTAWPHPIAARLAATVSSLALAMVLAGNQGSAAWALLVAPVFLVGLVFVPDGLRDLARSALDRRRVTVQRLSP
jgi:hypothetical protein